MKKIILITAIFINFSYSFSQSKKEQIVTLQNTLDSFQFELNNVLLIKNNLTLYSDSITKILLEKQSITKAIKDTNNNLETQFKHSRNKIDSLILVKELKEKELKDIQNELALAIKKKNEENEIVIGTQTWMKKDISTEYFNNGDKINQAKNEKEWVQFCNNKVPCYYKMKDDRLLYNGYVIADPRGITPKGYKVPSVNDFEQLFKFLGGGNNTDGNATKSLINYTFTTEDENMNQVNVKGTNSSGFKATQGGFLYPHGLGQINTTCNYWWTNNKVKINIVEMIDNGQEVEKNEKGYIGFNIGYCSQDAGGGYYEGIDELTGEKIKNRDGLLLLFSLSSGLSIRCIKSN
jgi:uncharacterized protein (TIGR02145 family)